MNAEVRPPHRLPPLWFLAQISLLLVAATLAALSLARGGVLGSEFTNDLHPALGLDRISGYFLLLIAAIGIPAALASLWTNPARQRQIGWLSFGFLGAMILVVTARDPVTLILAWEGMTLLPAAAILVHDRSPEARRALLIYLGLTHLAGAGVWAGLLMLASGGHFTPGSGAT